MEERRGVGGGRLHDTAGVIALAARLISKDPGHDDRIIPVWNASECVHSVGQCEQEGGKDVLAVWICVEVISFVCLR